MDLCELPVGNSSTSYSTQSFSKANLMNVCSMCLSPDECKTFMNNDTLQRLYESRYQKQEKRIKLFRDYKYDRQHQTSNFCVSHLDRFPPSPALQYKNTNMKTFVLDFHIQMNLPFFCFGIYCLIFIMPSFTVLYG